MFYSCGERGLENCASRHFTYFSYFVYILLYLVSALLFFTVASLFPSVSEASHLELKIELKIEIQSLSSLTTFPL